MCATPAAAEQQHSLFPRDPLGARLCEIFSYLWKPITAANTPAPEWKTMNRHPLRPRVQWQWWQDAMKLVGVRFSPYTKYGLIDIDRLSPYHPLHDPEALKTLCAALETIGIYRTVLITSSSSGGLHLYIPLPYEVPTFGLASALRQCVEAQDFEVAPGKLEIFPNTKAYGFGGNIVEYNAHRLPLQPNSGSVLLDDDHNPSGNDLGQFFKAWDWAADGQCLEEIKEAIGIALANRSKRRLRRLTIVEDWRKDLQTEINDGWTDFGQTNALLKTIACYGVVFEALTGEALATFVRDTAMNSPGYEEFCRHQHEMTRRSTVWARAAEKYYWALGTDPKREGRFSDQPADLSNVIPINQNELRSQDAKDRIVAAVERLRSEGQLPDEATPRRDAISGQGISPKTLYKYPQLWHPEHLNYNTVEETRCILTDPEPISADLKAETTEMGKTPEPIQSKEVYTLEGNMKCEILEPPLSQELPSHEKIKTEAGSGFATKGTPRRNPSNKSVTAPAKVIPLKRLSGEVFELRATVTPQKAENSSAVPEECPMLYPVLIPDGQTLASRDDAFLLHRSKCEAADELQPGDIVQLAEGYFVLDEDLMPMNPATRAEIERARRDGS